MFLKDFAFLKGIEIILAVVTFPFLTELESLLIGTAITLFLANRDGSEEIFFNVSILITIRKPFSPC